MRRAFAAVTLSGAHRGNGVLRMKGHAIPVHYDLSVFEQRGIRTASGSVEGDLRPLGELAEDPEGVLRLATGREVAVRLSDADADGAAIETADDPAVEDPA